MIPLGVKTLDIDLEKFGLVEREKVDAREKRNRCGRDFLYYALHYLFPAIHNPNKLNPAEIERQGLFGLSLPVWLAWTQTQFMRMPSYCKKLGAELSINKKAVKTFLDFVLAISFPSGISYSEGMGMIEKAIAEKRAVGVDISVGWGGLLDHVMFVCGFDADNLYVFDTHVVPIEYEKLTPPGDPRFIMRLPKDVVKKRWGIYGRVWTVSGVKVFEIE